MDLVSAIGLISSFVTLEEAGRSWILIIKDKIKEKKLISIIGIQMIL
jgi:hypothetical protein